jgi:excisionase family DNA binding protein
MSMDNGDTVLLTLDEVAKRLGVGRRTIEREIQRGRFPAPLKIGPRITRVPAGALQAYVQMLGAKARETFAERHRALKHAGPLPRQSTMAGLPGATWEDRTHAGPPSPVPIVRDEASALAAGYTPEEIAAAKKWLARK